VSWRAQEELKQLMIPNKSQAQRNACNGILIQLRPLVVAYLKSLCGAEVPTDNEKAKRARLTALNEICKVEKSNLNTQDFGVGFMYYRRLNLQTAGKWPGDDGAALKRHVQRWRASQGERSGSGQAEASGSGVVQAAGAKRPADNATLERRTSPRKKQAKLSFTGSQPSSSASQPSSSAS